jgi:hypothetical protein
MQVPVFGRSIKGAEQTVENVAEIALEDVHLGFGDRHSLRPVVDDGQLLDIKGVGRRIAASRSRQRRGIVAIVVEVVGKRLWDWPPWSSPSGAGMLRAHGILRGSLVVSGELAAPELGEAWREIGGR